MKLPLLLIGLPLLLAGADLRVMTFNVRYPSPGDGENVWAKRRDLAVSTIRDQNPDIIGTQELFYEQGQYIVDKLPGYAWFGLSRRGNHEDEHMGVFYRKDRLKLLDSGNFWLSETPDKPGSQSWNMSLPRMATWGLFELVEGGKRFYFYNTHFAHRAEDGEARLKSAQLLRQRIDALPDAVPVILAGDFNTGLDSEPHRVLVGEMPDAWQDCPRRSGPEGTFHGFSGKPRRDRIDWILYRGPLKVRSAETVTNSENGHFPSDHFPVAVTFDLR